MRKYGTSNDNKAFRLACLLLCVMLCFGLSGCATIGAAGAGFTKLLTTVVLLPFKILSGIVDVVNKLPKPPPGVFF